MTRSNNYIASLIAPRLRELMAERGMHAKALADAAGINYVQMLKYVRTKGPTLPTDDNLDKLAAALGVEVEAIIQGPEPSAGVREPLPAAPADGGHGLTATDIRAANLATGLDVAVPPELKRAEVLSLEFGAWLRYISLRRPAAMDIIEAKVRRLIDDVERDSLPRAPSEAGQAGRGRVIYIADWLGSGRM